VSELNENPDQREQTEHLMSAGKLVLAARLCLRYKIDINSLESTSVAVRTAYEKGRYQDILGAYKLVGRFGPYSIEDLLRHLAGAGNHSTFLKFYVAFEESGLEAEARSALLARVRTLVGKGSLVKAARTCRTQGVNPGSIKVLVEALDDAYQDRQYQQILSAYYEAGIFASFEVDDLLRRLFKTGMMAAFLVNAYRFEKKDDFSREISAAIQWHRDRGLQDADAWQRKFDDLQPLPSTVAIYDLATAPEVKGSITVARMKSVSPSERKPQTQPHRDSSDDDPYIISQVSRVKVEQASAEHQRVLTILEDALDALSIELANSKLIDLMGIKADWQAIFEVKSITKDNERDQVRHAVSQLLEYRFLHAIPSAALFAVFSEEPFSGWLVDYLRDLGIGVLWVEDGCLSGPAHAQLLGRV